MILEAKIKDRYFLFSGKNVIVTLTVCASQILCEINFMRFKNLKSVIWFLTVLEPIDFDFSKYIIQKSNSRVFRIRSSSNFWGSKKGKFGFTQNPSSRKIVEYPHSDLHRVEERETYSNILLFWQKFRETNVFTNIILMSK